MSVFEEFTCPVKKPERAILGRQDDMQKIFASLCRSEICNVILLAPAGAGKTAIVQGLSVLDQTNVYYEVNLSKMRSSYDEAGFATAISELCNEATQRSTPDCGVVLFIDEFHIIVQLSAAAVEAIKPVLADSGTRGLKIIAATTYEEFEKYIKPNLPLVQRLHRINILPPTDNVTIGILQGYAERYGIADKINPRLYHRIVEVTNRYLPANSQPRKSLMVLDSMMGYYRMSCLGGKDNAVAFDNRLLQKVIWESEGVKISTKVDPTTIKSRLDSKVFAQDFATSAIETRLQVAVADINRHDRPMATFLFSGPTGVGKTQTVKEMANIMFDDPNAFIRFDMTEFSQPDSVERFREELCSKMWERPNSVLLLDEIEKANSTVVRALLPVLDDGRMTDKYNRVVSFLNSYIIMTTNAGSDIYSIIAQYDSSNTGSKQHMSQYLKMIKRHLSTATAGDISGQKFPPELLGRVDAIIPFTPLSVATQNAIVKKRLAEIIDEVHRRYGINIVYDPNRVDNNLIKYIVEDQNSTEANEGGARSLLGTIDSDVVSAISRAINIGGCNFKTLEIVVKGEMAAGNKFNPESSAYVEVVPIN